MPERIVIIGANSAGVSAAIAARKTEVKAELTLISEEEHLPYSRCGLPYVLSGGIPDFKSLVLFPPSYYTLMKLNLRTKTAVKSVNPEERLVLVENEGGDRETINYDCLLLATGATPFIPPIDGVDKDGVLTLRGIDDGKEIQKFMGEARSAIVVGAGYAGLELAHALVKKKVEAILIERVPQILPGMLDREMSERVRKKIEKKGVKVIVGREVEEVVGGCEATGVVVGGEELEADLVLMATGVRPRVELAREMELKIGSTGGVKVNPRMETSIPGVYAAGDCVESSSMLTGQPVLSQLGTTAERQGKVAGINIAGGYAVFPGILDSAVSTFFDFEVGATGFTEFYAQQTGFKTVSGTITDKTRAEYYPGGKEITVKIVAEPDLGKVIGGQIIGGEEVTQRINMISIAIQKQMCVSELSKADTCYAPSVCSPWEPVVLAAELVVKKMRRRIFLKGSF